MVGCVETRAGTEHAMRGKRLKEARESRSWHGMNQQPIDCRLDDRSAPGSRGRRLNINLDFKARWFWAVVVVLLSAWIIHGFFLPVAWALIIAVATWPLYRRFASRMPSRMASSATPLAFTILVSSFILGPMVFAFGAVAVEAQSWLARLALADRTGLAAPAWLDSLPLVGGKLVERWEFLLGTPGAMSGWLQRADSSAFFGWAQTLGAFVVYHLFVVVFTVLVLFFIYRGGDEQALRLNRVLLSAIGDRVAPYLDLAIQAVRATVISMVAVALFDGVLIGIIYAVSGIPHAAVWGAVTGLFSMIPYMCYVAVVGVALALVAKGAVAPALAVCILGGTVHFVADKILRPVLVGGAVKLGFVWVLMSSLGGLEVMGLLGVLVGPVVLALASSLWRERAKNRGRSSPERSTAASTDRNSPG